MTKIAAMGDNVVDCYVSKDTMFPGGNCLNVSVFIKRFGGSSAYLGAIGKDDAGDLIQAALAEEGVDTSHLRVLQAGSTAYCMIGHRNADRVFLRADLGVSMFEPSIGDIEFLSGFDAVHIGQSSGLDAFLVQAAEKTRLSYDFSTRRDADHRLAIAPLCFLASISGGGLSRDEALALVQDVRAAGAKWVLVTRGDEGAILCGEGGFLEVPAAPAELVDTLGAGDTFIARTLYGLTRGEAPQDLLAAAAAAAAETCRYFGAIGYPAPISLTGDVPELRQGETTG